MVALYFFLLKWRSFDTSTNLMIEFDKISEAITRMETASAFNFFFFSFGSFDNVLITTVCGMFQTNSLTCRVVSTVTVRDRVGYSWNDDVPCNSVDKVQQRILHEKNSPSWNLCKSNMKTNFNFEAFLKIHLSEKALERFILKCLCKTNQYIIYI